MHILLTAFEPFNGLTANPSSAILEALAASDLPGIRLTTARLPVVYRAAGEQIAALVRDHQPDAVIMLGVAQHRAQISLERIALNLDDATIPDNAGDFAEGRAILPGAPDLYWSTLPLNALRDALRARSIPVHISNHAGAYVCNHVFYSARHALAERRVEIPCGFIHVPLMAEQADAHADAPGLPLLLLVEAVRVCLEVIRENQ